MTLEKLLEEFPACLCRLLARENGRPLSSRELARRSGLTRDRVDYISQTSNWQFIRIGEALRFLKACGVELTSLRRHREFIKRNNWGHLEYGPKTYYAKLMRHWIESRHAYANT